MKDPYKITKEIQGIRRKHTILGPKMYFKNTNHTKYLTQIKAANAFRFKCYKEKNYPGINMDQKQMHESRG
jgi:hypothetical protein